MKRDYSGWFGGGIVILGLLIMYVWSSYTDLAERRLAYLYHPESDVIYSVRLAPMVSKYRKWDPFIPFKRLRYSKPDGAEYLGNLKSILEEERRDRTLMEKDFDAWMEKTSREFDESMNETRGAESTLEYWDVEYSIRDIERPVERLGDPVQQIVNVQGIREGEILAVDAVVIRKTYRLDGSHESSRPSISVLRNAFLFKGAPAALLHEKGV